MAMTSEFPTILYGFIAIVVVVALFYSWTTGKSTEKYFWAEGLQRYSVLVLSLFLVLFANTVIIVLPAFATYPFLLPLVAIVFAFVLMPMLFGTKILDATKKVVDKSSSVGKSILGIHGLVYVGVIQILIYMYIADRVLSEFFAGSNFSIQVSIIIAAGIYTLVGGMSAVLFANVVIVAAVVIGLLCMLFFPILTHGSDFAILQRLLEESSHLFQMSNMAQPHALIAWIALVCLISWLVWFDMGMIHKQSIIRREALSSRIIAGSGVLASIAILIITFVTNRSSSQFANPTSSTVQILTTVIAVGLLSGVMGLLALSFQTFSTLIAVILHPLVEKNTDGEKQVLIGRLSTVLIVLLAVLLVFLGKILDKQVVVQYLNFMAIGTMPIVGVFILALLLNRGISGSLVIGLLLGEAYAIIEFYFCNGGIAGSLFYSMSIYAVAVENILATLLFGMAAVRFNESSIGQRLLLRIGFTRTLVSK